MQSIAVCISLQVEHAAPEAVAESPSEAARVDAPVCDVAMSTLMCKLAIISLWHRKIPKDLGENISPVSRRQNQSFLESRI